MSRTLCQSNKEHNINCCYLLHCIRQPRHSKKAGRIMQVSTDKDTEIAYSWFPLIPWSSACVHLTKPRGAQTGVANFTQDCFLMERPPTCRRTLPIQHVRPTKTSSFIYAEDVEYTFHLYWVYFGRAQFDYWVCKIILGMWNSNCGCAKLYTKYLTAAQHFPNHLHVQHTVACAFHSALKECTLCGQVACTC